MQTRTEHFNERTETLIRITDLGERSAVVTLETVTGQDQAANMIEAALFLQRSNR